MHYWVIAAIRSWQLSLAHNWHSLPLCHCYYIYLIHYCNRLFDLNIQQL